MIHEDLLLNNKMVKLSDSNRQIIEDALLAYKNTTVYLSMSNECIEILELEIDEILEKVVD